jgi:signal transduction histidine kinase/CheY-like chemotaxis protein
MNQVCPVTNLPIESRPEWSDLRIADQYHVTFKKIGNNILLNIPYGNMEYYDCDHYFELRQKVIKEAFPQDVTYVDIKGYDKLTGTPSFKERQKLMKKLIADAERCRGYIIYGQSMLVTLIFKTAVAMLGRIPYPARAVNDYEAAISFALNLIKSDDSSYSDLQSQGFFTKKEWHYHNSARDCSIGFMVSNENVLFSRFSGRACPEDLIQVENILDMILKEEFIANRYQKITQFVNFSISSVAIRKGYAEVLNRLHEKYSIRPDKSYICTSSPFIKIFLLFGAPLVKISLIFVKSPLDALNAIRATGSQKKKREKLFTISEADLNSLTTLISMVAWDIDSDKSFFEPQSPLKQIETAISLVKKDREVIFSELESKNNDLKAVIEELKKARDTAESAMVTKSQFLANMSHELRTPLNGVIGSAELLNETNLNDEQQSFLSIIYKSSVHLLAVINDILDYSKIESGQIKLEEIPFELISVIDDVVSIVHSQTLDKRLPVVVAVNGPLRHLFKGDQFRLRQVLLNLVQNAIKFTNIGYIRIVIKVIDENVDFQTVALDITDTGVGIDQNKIPMLFNQFVQADSSTTRKFGGTGLGLVIVKQLVELMGGKVTINSVLGKGSTFSITIPLKKTENEETLAGSKENQEYKVIILAQDPYEREWYAETFVKDGATVLLSGMCFEDGSEVYSKNIIHEKNAICIVDPGFDTTDPNQLLTLCKETHNRVVYVRNLQSGLSINDLNGILVYNKPLKIKEFPSILKNCFTEQSALSKKSKDEDLQGKKDNQKCAILLVEDSPTNQIVAKKLLEKIGYSDITTCNNGREAICLLEQRVFDLIFMDCQMPEIDGFEATEIIRNNESKVKSHDIFIIAFTAHAMQEELQKCFTSGMNDYVLKPVTIDSLKSVLKRYHDTRIIS